MTNELEIKVMRNNADRYTELQDSVYFFAVNASAKEKTLGALSADEAEELGNKLLEVAAEVRRVVAEKNKVNGEDFVNALPIGSRFRWPNQPEYQYWIKVADDEVYLYSTSGLNSTPLAAKHFVQDDLYVVEG
jgi:hypothetical protein